MATRPSVGLYLLADATALRHEHLESVLRAGARVLQYREKQQLPSLANLRRARQLCRQYGALFVINDDLDLALAVAADGVHLGRDDWPVAEARARLGQSFWIGASCYGDLDRAAHALAEGADYVAFGSFFASATKPDAKAAPATILAQAHARWTCPIVAIGGITPDNGGSLLAAGADLLAVASGVWAAPDPEAATRRYLELFRGG